MYHNYFEALAEEDDRKGLEPDDDVFGLRTLPSNRENSRPDTTDAEPRATRSFNPETDLVDLTDPTDGAGHEPSRYCRPERAGTIWPKIIDTIKSPASLQQNTSDNAPLAIQGLFDSSDIQPDSKVEGPDHVAETNSVDEYDRQRELDTQFIASIPPEHLARLNPSIPLQPEGAGTSHTTPNTSEPTRKLFVGCLDWGVDKERLRREFQKFGSVLDCYVHVRKPINRPAGHGFVTFAKISDAVRALEAMNGVALNGRALALDFHRPKKGSPAKINTRSGNLSNGTSRPTNPTAVRSEQTLNFGTAQRTNGSGHTSAKVNKVHQHTGNRHSTLVPAATPAVGPGSPGRSQHVRRNAQAWQLPSAQNPVLDVHPSERALSRTVYTKPATQDQQVFTLSRDNFTTQREAACNNRGGVPAAVNRNRIPQILTERDNEAQAAWRRRDQPAKRFRLPRNFNPIGETRSSGSRAQPNFPRIEQIAVATSTHIVPFRIGSAASVELHIWGSQERVDAAIAEIKAWIDQTIPRKRTASSADWAKIPSLSDKQKEKIERRLKAEAKRQAFRKLPPQGTDFAFIHNVPWPLADYRPEQVLGNSLEAFDPIRMDCSCYITLARYPGCTDFAVVKIMGNDEQGFRKAEKRVVNTYRQVQSRDFTPAQWFLVRSPNLSAPRTHILISPYEAPSAATSDGISEAAGMVPRYYGPQFTLSKLKERRNLVDETGADAVLAEGPLVEQRNLLMIESVILSTLRLLTYHRGNLQIRAHLGTFVMTKYRMPKDNQYLLEQLEEIFTEHNLEEGQMEAYVTKELGDRDLENDALVRYNRANDVLAPHDAMAAELCNMKPVYSAVFIIDNPDRDSGSFQLEVEFKRGEYHDFEPDESRKGYETVLRRWSKLELGKDDATSMMEVDLADLQGGNSYQLAITATGLVDESRLPASYRTFADKVGLNIDAAEKVHGTHCFFHFAAHDRPASVPVRALHQKRAWRYTISGSEYIVEVATVQKIVIQPGTTVSMPYEVRWAVSLWHPCWDLHLGANSNLSIGEQASWRADEFKFFPPDPTKDKESTGDRILFKGDGFKTLLQKLHMIERLVQGQ